uniref:Immunoglobulin domain-containing protein n=1 Tax=Sphaeramia orbicularis TaxID=375764 RepID=A0A673CNB4_9TELE
GFTTVLSSSHLWLFLSASSSSSLVSQVSHSYVTVEEGGSISIPCFYESEYTDHVKYLCKGHTWESCTYEVKTNEKSSTKYSVSDNKNQRMVTKKKKKKQFETSSVNTHKVTGFIGDQITIDCHYRGSKQIKWCRTGGEGPTSCIKDSGKIDETKVTINRNTPGVITVTMSELRERSSGWYWCTDEDLQMPVHVTIKERPTTITYSTVTYVRITATQVNK